MDRHIASRYLNERYKPDDRLAIVLVHKPSGAVTQRLAAAERIASPEFQAWLRHKNAQKHEVYVSMNTLHAHARGRTKADVHEIRHVYLDFDEDGTEAVQRLLKRSDLPTPNVRISSSPGKWQVAWTVEGFTLEQAEALQRWLARDTGADVAATDAARVLRLPGFYNHKYSERHLVTHETLSDRVCRPEDFPAPQRPHNDGPSAPLAHGDLPKSALSQSERDWAFAKRALARGEPEDLVTLAIAVLRKSEKHDPYSYAQRTVQKAASQLRSETPNREVGDISR
jgi:hypothetical protein